MATTDSMANAAASAAHADLYSMTTFMPRAAGQSSTADGGKKRAPEDLEDELARMRECSKAALSSSWADAERLRTEATETETRIKDVARLIQELKEEEQLRKDELVELPGNGEDISADARRASWFSWDDGSNTGCSSHLAGGAGGGIGASASAGDGDGHGNDDDDDSIDTEDLAMIEKRFGGSTKPSARSAAGVPSTSSGENPGEKSTVASTAVANSGERRISWQRNLVESSSARRRSSTVDGSLGRLDEDSVACMDVSAGRLSLEDDAGSQPSLQGINSGGKADGSLAAEERLMAQLSVIQAKMTDETSKLRSDIDNRSDSIEKLQNSTQEQLNEIITLKREYSSIKSSMEGENEVLRCEIDALQSQVNRLLVQDAALDKELKKVMSKITAAREQDQSDEINRLRAQVLAASENLKLVRACRSAGPTAAAAAAVSGVQHDRHGEEEEDGVHIDVDGVSDDMSAITVETFFSGGAPGSNNFAERK